MNALHRNELSRLVLRLLEATEVAGPELRVRLASCGIALSPLAFDGMMASLEIGGFVRGRYAPETEHDRQSSRLYRPARAPERSLTGGLRPAA